MAVEQSSTPAVDRKTANVADAETPTRKRRNCKTCNVLNLGRRKEDARPLIGEILAICEGISDEGLKEIPPYASAFMWSRSARRKEDARLPLRDIAVICSIIDDAGLAFIKSYALEVAAEHPLTVAQEPEKQTAQVIDLAAWRARKQS